MPRGGPDGGDGGRGGSICAIADRNINTLIDYRYARIHRAKRGENGRGADQYGRGADDIVLRMPVGTVITDADTGELIADLAARRRRARCSRKAARAASATCISSRAPIARRGNSTPGEEGEQRMLHLELKVLADVGLLGMPNAGKSTLIRAISAARPKVADYPFTTLAPNLGVVRIDENRSFVVADIPGLIEGAADGAGLGHQFLRHLQRTRLLLHVVDLAPLDPDADPVRDARAIVNELERYDQALVRQAALAGAEQARPRSEAASATQRVAGVRRSPIAGRGRCSRSPRSTATAAASSCTRSRTGSTRIPRAPAPATRRMPIATRRDVAATCACDSPCRATSVAAGARRLVVKVGSSLVTNDGRGLDHAAVARWAAQIAELDAERGDEIVLVSSGAIAEGMQRLGWTHAAHRRSTSCRPPPRSARWDSSRPTRPRSRSFGLHTAQVLLTHDDLADRRRYLNARSTLRRCSSSA